jgi:hypothetical protein
LKHALEGGHQKHSQNRKFGGTRPAFGFAGPKRALVTYCKPYLCRYHKVQQKSWHKFSPKSKVSEKKTKKFLAVTVENSKTIHVHSHKRPPLAVGVQFVFSGYG